MSPRLLLNLIPPKKKDLMLECEVVMPGDGLFDEVNRQCETVYWRCGLLDHKTRFDYNPDYFFIVKSNVILSSK